MSSSCPQVATTTTAAAGSGTEHLLPTTNIAAGLLPTTTTSSSSSRSVLFYMTIFFTAMILHELALEAVTTSFPDLDALTSTVTLFQFGSCFLMPLLLSQGTTLDTFPRSHIECIPYLKLSFVVFGATALATQSLVYVNYPTKVVFKSAKLIPTMIVSTIVNPQKVGSYGWMDYTAAMLLCMGAAGYSYGSGSSPSSSSGGGGGDGTGGGTGGGDNNDRSSSWYGIALLTVSILCDALVPNLQQRLMASPPPTNNNKGNSEVTDLPLVQKETTAKNGRSGGRRNGTTDDCGSSSISRSSSGTGGKGDDRLGLSAAALMVNANAVGFACLLIYMTLSGSLFGSIHASVTHPVLLMYLTLIGFGLSTAVFAYTKLIKASGSVVAVAVATLRKVMTVILSYVIFPKPILPVHVISGFVVLGGLVLSSVSRQRGGGSAR